MSDWYEREMANAGEPGGWYWRSSWPADRVDTKADTMPAPAFVLAAACPCSVRYDEDGWRRLEYLGARKGLDGEILSCRECAFCGCVVERHYDAEKSP